MQGSRRVYWTWRPGCHWEPRPEQVWSVGRQPHQAEQLDGGSRRLLATGLTRDGGREVQQEFLFLLLQWERLSMF